MDQLLSRRSLIVAGCTLPLLALPGCNSIPGFGMVDALRRLLTLSSQRAFASLLQDNGFFQDEVARIPLPPQLDRAGGIASALLGSGLVQNQPLRSLDDGVLNQVVRATTGIDFSGLQRHVTDSAARGIYRAIGREEAAIRANPRATNDPVLIGVFGVLG